MEIGTIAALHVSDQSIAAEARRTVARLASQLAFDEGESGKLAIIVTELVTNIVKHARHGQLLINHLGEREAHHGIGVISLDKGPGIANMAACLRDGYSTAGSPGTGLGAVRRLSSEFDIHSQPGVGTVVYASLWSGAGARENSGTPVELATVSVPKAGEPVSGDAWAARQGRGRVSIFMADGLGHGIHAADAAMMAVRCFQGCRDAGPVAVLQSVHSALRSTRGAAAALVEIDATQQVVRFAGVGNIAATIVAPEREYNLVSHNGTMGLEARRIQEFVYPWPAHSLLVMHSDGVSRRWHLEDYPGLATRAPVLIAATLYRDHARERDDATVVVAAQRGM